jgi:hypothetical protein
MRFINVPLKPLYFVLISILELLTSTNVLAYFVNLDTKEFERVLLKKMFDFPDIKLVAWASSSDGRFLVQTSANGVGVVSVDEEQKKLYFHDFEQ